MATEMPAAIRPYSIAVAIIATVAGLGTNLKGTFTSVSGALG